ncbi:MAG: hypothetical protein ACI8Z1_000323 [Candidatus Azotimanducaceae bacterium]|jgi:hypothetical protein
MFLRSRNGLCFLMGGFALRWKSVRRAQHSYTTQARIADVRLSACLWRAIFRILFSVDVIGMRLIVLGWNRRSVFWNSLGFEKSDPFSIERNRATGGSLRQELC